MLINKIKRIFILIDTYPERFFLIVALLFGSMSAVLVPQFTGYDEGMHFKRAYALSDLQVTSSTCIFPAQIIDRINSSNNNGDYKSYYRDTIKLDDQKISSCGSAAGYSPILHTPQAIGIAIAKYIHPSTGLMVLLGRLSSVIFYSLFLFFVIKYARIGKWAIIAIGLLPNMIHLSSTITADTVNNVLVLGFISYVFSLMVSKNKYTKKQIGILLCLYVMLSFTKIHNLALLPLLLLIPTKNLPFEIMKSTRIAKYTLIFSAGIISLLSIVLWQTISRIDVVPDAMLSDNPLIRQPLFFFVVLFNTYINPFVGYTNLVSESVVDAFSSFKYSLPSFMEYFVWTTLLLAFIHPSKHLNISNKSIKIATIVTLSTFAVLVAAVSYAMYTGWALLPSIIGPGADRAEGVQGRYFTAFLLLLLPLALWLQKYVKLSFSPPILHTSVITLSILASLTFYITTTLFFKILLI